MFTGNYDYYDGSLYNVGSYGYYWSRSAPSSNYAYDLTFDRSYVNPQGSNIRGFGFAIRVTSLTLSGTAASAD